MNRKKLTALLLSSIMAVTPAMPAMADQSTVSDYVEATADDVSDDTSDDTTIAPAPLPDPTVKSGWETVDGVKYYYENGEKVVNKAKKIGKYTYCFDKNGKLVTNKPYYKFNSKSQSNF